MLKHKMKYLSGKENNQKISQKQQLKKKKLIYFVDRCGDIINVTEKNGIEWWKGTVHGKNGYFPANYVEDFNLHSEKMKKKEKNKKKLRKSKGNLQDNSSAENEENDEEKRLVLKKSNGVDPNNKLKIVPVERERKNTNVRSRSNPSQIPQRKNLEEEYYYEDDYDYEDDYLEDDLDYLPHRSINLRRSSQRNLTRRNPNRVINQNTASRPSYMRANGLRN